MYGNGWMMGMHYIWWIFWVLLVIVVVALLLRGQSAEHPRRTEPGAMEILERRYAAGEISTQEFEERRAVLARTAR